MREALVSTSKNLAAGQITTGVDQGLHGGMAFDGKLTVEAYYYTCIPCSHFITVLPKKGTGVVISVNDALKAVGHPS